MDFGSHVLIGAALATPPRYSTGEKIAIAVSAVLADVIHAPAYLFLGHKMNRAFWIHQNSDWDGFAELHPVWMAFWEAPHSLTFLVLIIIPPVLILKLPRLIIAGYFSHIFLDIFTHIGDWSVKPFYPLRWQIEGFTDAWAWHFKFMLLSWIVLGLLIFGLNYYFRRRGGVADI